MSAQTISLRLPQDELDMLTILSHRLRLSKSTIIRSALKSVLDDNFNKPKSIVLSNRDFQTLLDEISKKPCEDVINRRRHLEEYSLWD